MTSRRVFLGGSTGVLIGSAFGAAAIAGLPVDPRLGRAAARGRQFLAGLFDPELDLLPEFAGSDTYWLFHDNYLAAKVLAGSHPKLSAKIRAAITRFGVERSGKIEILFGENARALPLRHYELKVVRRIGKKTVKTETAGNQVFEEFRLYADLLFYTSMAKSDPRRARQFYDDGLKLWDGRGFYDQAAKPPGHYATYKLALALLAAARIGINPPERQAILDRLLEQQSQSGGWTTDYDAASKPLGKANVETTSLAILAVPALDREPRR